LAHDEALGFTSHIDVRGNYAFICSYEIGLIITDISVPAQPVYVGSYPAQYFRSASTSENFVFAAEIDSGLFIINITDPFNPTLASHLGFPGHTEDISIRGDYGYIANLENGLYIVDISDYSNPILIDSCDTPGSAVGISLEGDFAYIADGNQGLQIINVQDPTNPFLSFNVQTEDYAQDVVVSGNYAIVADDSAGVQVVDISDPGAPQIVANYNTPGEAVDLEIVGDYIYVADYYSLMILYLDRETGMLEPKEMTPSNFYLSQNYPNPFNTQTTINYDVPIASRVVIEIYDILGRKVETLVDGFRSPGSYKAVWNARDLSSGLYFYRLRADNYSEIKRMIYIK